MFGRSPGFIEHLRGRIRLGADELGRKDRRRRASARVSVRFKLTEQTGKGVDDYIRPLARSPANFCSVAVVITNRCMTNRQYA
jgi:hypothetical protein